MDGAFVGGSYPVVARFEGMWPHQLAGYEAHRTRRGGDMGHIDRERSHLNRRLIGAEDWAAKALSEIEAMRTANFAEELESLEKRKRRKDIKRRMVEGPKDPWRSSKHGPMRELILTVNREWFEHAHPRPELWESREDAFEDFAKVWLRQNFGRDVIHARADLDEAAYHIHAVIMPRATVEIKGAKRRMLQPSIHPLIKDYEAAQDSVGAHFAPLGLVRGQNRAAWIREARATGEEPPARRIHARPSEWRASEDLRLSLMDEGLEAQALRMDQRDADATRHWRGLEEREQQLDAERRRLEAREQELAEERRRIKEREDEAEVVLGLADSLASGELVIREHSERAVLTTSEQSSPELRAGAAERAKSLKKQSPTGYKRAKRAFGRAWSSLRRDAREEARVKAEQDLAEAIVELDEVEETAIAAVNGMSADLRREFAKAWIPVVQRLSQLRSWVASHREVGDRVRTARQRPLQDDR